MREKMHYMSKYQCDPKLLTIVVQLVLTIFTPTIITKIYLLKTYWRMSSWKSPLYRRRNIFIYQYIECWECYSCSYYSYYVTFLPHPRVRYVCLKDLDLLTVLSVDGTCNCLYMGMYVCMYVCVILVLFWCYFKLF